MYGSPACASQLLLSTILRGQWGFKGDVVSDCGAIFDFFASHFVDGRRFSPTVEAASATAIRAGCDMCCGLEYRTLSDAVHDGLLTEHEVEVAASRVLETRFRLGMFDSPSLVPYAQIPANDYDTPAHDELALRMARNTLTLLKNDGLLPLDRAKIHKIAVLGVNANYAAMLVANYNGVPSHAITMLAGIEKLLGTNVEVAYDPGCPLARGLGDTNQAVYAQVAARALNVAQSSDAIIYVGGITADLEREQMQVPFEGFFGGDRTRIELPPPQTEFLKSLKATGKPLVFVNCSGSALAMPWEAENLSAILQAWYPGQEGGRAVAEALFGDVNPGQASPSPFTAAPPTCPSSPTTPWPTGPTNTSRANPSSPLATA